MTDPGSSGRSDHRSAAGVTYRAESSVAQNSEGKTIWSDTAARACRALVHREQDGARAISDPGLRTPVQKRAKCAGELAERFEAARRHELARTWFDVTSAVLNRMRRDVADLPELEAVGPLGLRNLGATRSISCRRYMSSRRDTPPVTATESATDGVIQKAPAME